MNNIDENTTLKIVKIEIYHKFDFLPAASAELHVYIGRQPNYKQPAWGRKNPVPDEWSEGQVTIKPNMPFRVRANLITIPAFLRFCKICHFLPMVIQATGECNCNSKLKQKQTTEVTRSNMAQFVYIYPSKNQRKSKGFHPGMYEVTSYNVLLDLHTCRCLL